MLQEQQYQFLEVLTSSIDSLFEHRDIYLCNPLTDFSRTKKISFNQTILFPMIAGSDNAAEELLDFFGEKEMPLPSSMIQRRSQIKPEAFMDLFSSFTEKIPLTNTFCGYYIASMDGSRLNLPYNPSDPFSFIQCIEGRKGINQVHLNLLHDPLNDIFLDVEIQGIHQMDEKMAFCHLLDIQKQKNPGQKTIFLADRGYASFNIFAHAIHNNQKFLIRVPERFAGSLCLEDPNWLEGKCFDKEIIIHVGRRKTKKTKQLQNYHHIPGSRTYDFIQAGSEETDALKIRVLKFPISEDTFEFIVTNLPSHAFSLATIKKLYHLRWNEETAFRHLKYAGNMVHLHSRKWSFLVQEIYAKLTMYNFSSSLIALTGRTKKDTTRYKYVINHTQAQKCCVSFLKGNVKNILDLISRFLVPVRPGRKFERNLRRQSADTFTYR